MDKIARYRQTIESVLEEYTQIPYAYGEVDPIVVYDRERDHYLLLAVGWEGVKRVHGCIVHVSIRDDKIWIQQDGTEDGVTDRLIAQGVPPEEIVLAFHPAKMRQFTGFAVE